MAQFDRVAHLETRVKSLQNSLDESAKKCEQYEGMLEEYEKRAKDPKYSNQSMQDVISEKDEAYHELLEEYASVLTKYLSIKDKKNVYFSEGYEIGHQNGIDEGFKVGYDKGFLAGVREVLTTGSAFKDILNFE